MSCQQAPRFNEDPYTFTEITPATVTLYNPQVHKLALTPTTPNTKTQFLQTSQDNTPTEIILPALVQQKTFNTRLNGFTQLVNGVHKTINTGTTNTNAKLQQQIHNQLQGKLTANITSANFFQLSSSGNNIVQPSHTFSEIITHPAIFTESPIILQQQDNSKKTINIPPKSHSIINKNYITNKISQNTTGITSLNSGQIYSVYPNSINVIGTKPVQIPVTISSTIQGQYITQTETNLKVGQSLFITPGKKDIKTTTNYGKKVAKVRSATFARIKRSYSQSSQNETIQRLPTPTKIQSNVEWHAPDAYIFDIISPFVTISDESNLFISLPCMQNEWILDDNKEFDVFPSTREQRIDFRKSLLRRQAMQYLTAHKLRNSVNAKKRLVCVSKILKKFNLRDDISAKIECCIPSCNNSALALTAYCYLHITKNPDQYLFCPCTAKFSDNTQCRVPVFDISHELPLCREHAWKRDNYNRILQEQKPKRMQAKNPKSCTIIRPPKRNKKKKQNNLDNNVNKQNDSFLLDIKKENINLIKTENNVIHNNDNSYLIPGSDGLSVCENSSTYESSEDTGVGGLSETELIVGAHDVIEEIPLVDTRLLEEHDLTNVLNQLPVDAFNELFTTVQQNGPLEPTQEEQEDLERALEAVNKQVKSLQQMTGGDSNFLGDFLDVDDQMLDEADICTEVVLNSPSTNGIEANNIVEIATSNPPSSASIQELVPT